MWETIKDWAGPVFGFIGSLVTGGPLGLIGFGVGVVGLLIGGIWAYNKFKKWQFANAHKKQNEQSVKDHEKSVEQDIEHSKGDKKTFDKSKKDFEGAFDE